MSDFIIQQGTDASFTWPVTNDDGTAFNPAGWKAKLDIKSRYGNLLHSFSSDDSNLNFGNGVLVATWSADETKAWTWTGGRYDLYLYTDSEQQRVDAGYISVSQAVTIL
jgi:hypothetical protein